MKLEFLPRALDIYKELKASNPSLASKIKSFIVDTIEHPETGMGEPTKLAGIYDGLWVRRLSASEEMYYVFDDFKLVVVAFSLWQNMPSIGILDSPGGDSSTSRTVDSWVVG